MTGEEWFGLIAAYAFLCGIVAALAVSWGRSGVQWFLAALIVSPLLAFLVLVFSGKRA